MRLAALALAALLTAACLGPKPQVRSAEAGEPRDGKVDVTVVIVNRNSGDGQVAVRVTLKQGEKVVGRGEQTVELKANETITFVIEVEVPEDATDVDVDAEAVYPPD